MRGEDLPFTFLPSRDRETPPHARGRLAHKALYLKQPGNTPACAGKTSCFFAFWAWSRKHPRMRGEDPNTLMTLSSSVETPPHARGRPGHTEDSSRRRGNTPACAGKTVFNPSASRLVLKHPRMRGEDSKILYLFNDLPTKYEVLIQLRGDSCRYIPTPTMRRRVAGQSISERSVGRTGSGIPQAEGMSPSNLTPGLKSVKTRQVH